MNKSTGKAAVAPLEAPGNAALDRDQFLRPIAHRGLHNKAKGLIENTAPAFYAAIRKGYGIECDLQAAADGTPMVFHDAMLDRLIDAMGPIAALRPDALARLRYRGQDEKILSFETFLALVGGQVPVLVEVKINDRSPAPARFLEETAARAADYAGPLALMSFHAAVVAALGKLAPAIPRGLIVGTHQLPPTWWMRPGKRSTSPALSRLMATAPDGVGFLAVDVKMLPAAAEWNAANTKLPLFSWTVRTPKDRATAQRWADAPIFEGYEP